MSWENSDHPIVLFYQTPSGDVSGVDILSLNRDFVSGFIHNEMQRVLRANGIDLQRNWTKLSRAMAVEIIEGIEGRSGAHHGGGDECVRLVRI
jgi:hypothetical protein